MYIQTILYALPLIIGSTVALTICFLALQRYREPGVGPFIIGMAGVAIWAFAYALEIMAPTIEDKIIWHRIIYTMSGIVPAFWLLFLLQHEYGPSHRVRLWAILLCMEPLVYSIITWTNGHGHNWLWQSISLGSRGGLPYMVVTRSPGFYWHVAFTYLVVIASLLIFLRMLRKESSTLSLVQIIFLLLGVLSPVIANTLHITIFKELPINVTPFSLITMGAAVGWFAFRFELWDMLPAARDALFVNIHDGVVILNLNQVVIDINPAACRLLQLSEAQAIRQPMATLALDYPQLRHLQHVLHQPAGRNREEREIIFERPDFCVIEIVQADLRDRRGRANGKILTLRDITERRIVELQLAEERQQLAQRVAERTAELSRANAELANAARMKDEFLANMSHELRTPLNTILGLSEAILESIYGNITSAQQRAVQHVLDAGRHLLALINDILDVSKIEAGKFTLDPGPIAVDSLCQSSISFIRQEAQQKEISIHFTTDPTIRIIFGDERRIKQILVNLLSNAVKFTPKQGEIGLDVFGEIHEATIYFRVWDKGIGIAHVDMPLLFDPFVQLDSTLTRQHEGTGLGLALVHRMVELHGGSIQVESQLGVGSTFTVALPWHTSELNDMATWNAQNANNLGFDHFVRSLTDKNDRPETELHYTPIARQDSQLRELPYRPQNSDDESRPVSLPERAPLLLVEDNETNIRTFCDYLLTIGYPVDVVRSGSEALLYLQENQPPLILLDIQMPGMDGWQVARKIREMPNFINVPIIALTALAMPGDRERCFAAGMNEYLSKPVSLSNLRTVIKEYLA